MSRMLRTAGMVVGAVALIAATAGLAAPAMAVTATSAATAGGIAGVSAATLGAIGTYGALAAGALSMAAGATAPKPSMQGSATTFTTNPESGLPYVMGRTRMSGLRIYARTSNTPGYTKAEDLLWFGALLSIGGPIESIDQFTADNEVVAFNPSSGAASGRYAGWMSQKVHLGGTQASGLALTLNGGSPPDWTSAHRLSGITHAMWGLRFDKDGNHYGGGTVPEPAWLGRWVKVYDPRKDSTYPGGSGAHRALNEATYEWSDNPGLHGLTWVLGRWENGKRTCGVGSPVANIRVADFVECANVCDANGWKAGGVEWTTDGKWDPLKRILQAGGAIPTQTGAMIGCLVSAPRTAIATIESRHLLDGLNFPSTKSRRDRFNTVIPRYVDEASDWAMISGTAVTEPAYVAADGGQRTKEIDFPLVQVFGGQPARQPGQLAAYAIVNSREAGPFNWSTGPEWIGLKTGDVVYLNVPEEGLVNQPILITRRAPDPSTGKVSFSGETETFSKHAYALGQTTTPPPPFSLSAPDLKPVAPNASAFSVSGATSGEGFPALLVVGTSELPSADSLIIDYRRSGDTVWISSAILSAVQPVSHVIAPLASETAYDVRIGYRIGTIDGNFTIFANVVTGQGKITVIEAQLTDLDAEMLQLAADTAQALLDIAAAEATVIAMQDGVADLGDRVLAAEGEINAVEAVQTTQGASISTLQTTASTLEGELASLQSDLVTTNANVGLNASAITGLDASVALMSSEVGTLGASITTMQQAIDTVDGSVALLSSEVVAQGSSITVMQQALNNSELQVATLQTQVRTGGGNLLTNTTFADGAATGWGKSAPSWPTTFGVNIAGSIWQVAGESNIAILQPSVPGDGTGAGYADWYQEVSVEPLKWYDFSVLVSAARANVQMNAQFVDAAGAVLGSLGSGTITPKTGGTTINDQTPISLKGLAPTGTARAKLYLRKLGTNVTTTTGSYAWFHRPQIVETTATAATPVAYASGNERATIREFMSSTGGIFARWGVELDVNGYVSGVVMNNNGSRSDFNIRADKFSVVAPGGGARTEYLSGAWKVFDATGVLRVQLGNLAV